MGAGYNTTQTKFTRPGVYNRYKCFGGREADGFSVVPLSSLVEVMCVQKGWYWEGNGEQFIIVFIYLTLQPRLPFREPSRV